MTSYGSAADYNPTASEWDAYEQILANFLATNQLAGVNAEGQRAAVKTLIGMTVLKTLKCFDLFGWCKEFEKEVNNGGAQNSLQDLVQSWQAETIAKQIVQLEAKSEASVPVYLGTVGKAKSMMSYLRHCLSQPSSSAFRHEISDAGVEQDLQDMEAQIATIKEHGSGEILRRQQRRTLDCFLQVRLLERDVDEFLAQGADLVGKFSKVYLEPDVQEAEKQSHAHKRQVRKVKLVSQLLSQRAERLLLDLADDTVTKHGTTLRVELRSCTEPDGFGALSRSTIDMNSYVTQLIERLRRVTSEVECVAMMKSESLDVHSHLLKLEQQVNHVIGLLFDNEHTLRTSFLIPTSLMEAEEFESAYRNFHNDVESTQKSVQLCVQSAEELLQSLSNKQTPVDSKANSRNDNDNAESVQQSCYSSSVRERDQTSTQRQVQAMLNRVTENWIKLKEHAEERHKLSVASCNWYRTQEIVFAMLDKLDQEYKRPNDIQSTKGTIDERLQQLRVNIKQHFEQKDTFLKACTLARKTADSFKNHSDRSVKLAHNADARMSESFYEAVNTTLERLSDLKEEVREAWFARKKRLEQHLNFTILVKDMTDTLAAADRAVSTPGNTSSSKPRLLNNINNKMQSMQQYVQQCESANNSHVMHMRTVMEALERRSQSLQGQQPPSRSTSLQLQSSPAAVANVADEPADTAVTAVTAVTVDTAAATNGNPVVKIDAARRLQFIMNELLKTERTYVKDLETCMKTYLDAFSDPTRNHLVPTVLKGQEQLIFINIPAILSFHKETLLPELEAFESRPLEIGACFVKWHDELTSMYAEYCKGKQKSNKLIIDHGLAFFKQVQESHQLPMEINAYLIKPTQRISKYHLLLNELKSTLEDDQQSTINDGLEKMLIVLSKVNEAVHLSILGDAVTSKCGRLLLQDRFTVWNWTDMFSKKARERRVFLFDNCLLFAKECKDPSGLVDRYALKRRYDLLSVGITECVKDDSNKFAVWFYTGSPNSQHRVEFKASSFECKQRWIKAIREAVLCCTEQAMNDTSYMPVDTELVQKRATSTLGNGGLVSRKLSKRGSREPDPQKSTKKLATKVSFRKLK